MIEQGQPQRAALFDAGDGSRLSLLERSVPEDALFAVTVEDDEGANRPSGRPVFTAEPA